MKFLKEYNQFILEEVSKNEPIPELIGTDRGLAIFLIGAPGIGKSYFVKNHIHTKNRNIKDFSTDDVSLLYTKDPNIYYKGREIPEGGRTKNASELNLDRMKKFMETGQNFIYDTTGSGKEFTDRGFEHVKEIFDESKINGYKIIFIHLLSTLQTSIEQDKLRDRHVDPHYIQWAYAKQQGGEVDGIKVDGNIQRYKSLNPDAYYLVTSIDKKYKFYKFIDGKLAVRKNDKYVIKESIDNKSVISDIVDCVLDLIEDGYKITFKSTLGDMTYQQYLDGGGDFQPVVNPTGGVEVSQFTIRFSTNEKFKTYEDFVKIVDEMQVTIARLQDLGWSFAKFDVTGFEGYNNDETPDAKFNTIDYKFKKTDKKIGDKKFDVEQFKKYFSEKTGLHIENIKEYDDNIYVEFESIDFDGELPRNVDDRLERVAELYGFATFDYRWPNKYVYFFWEDSLELPI
jgi:predicted kinase